MHKFDNKIVLDQVGQLFNKRAACLH